MESSPQLSFEVLFYCRGPEVIKVHGNARVDPSEVLNTSPNCPSEPSFEVKRMQTGKAVLFSWCNRSMVLTTPTCDANI